MCAAVQRILCAGQTRKQRANGAGMETDPDRKTDHSQEKQRDGQPATRSGKLHPALKWMRAGEHDMPGGSQDQHPLGNENEREKPEQPITKDGPATRGKDELACADGKRSNDGAWSKNGQPTQRVAG